MTNLAEFKQEMQCLMKPVIERLKLEPFNLCPTYLRPFVCDGSPLECNVFLVGSRPVTEMLSSTWCFWSDDCGFDKCRWFEKYKHTRRELPLKPGKKSRHCISPTRKRINFVIEAAYPVNCLDTNIYAIPFEDSNEYKQFKKDLKTLRQEEIQQQFTAPLHYLLEQVNPKLVVAYTDDAQNYFRDHPPECKLWCEDNFARPGYKDDDARNLGHRIHKFF